MGREHFWFTVEPMTRHSEGTDLWAIGHELISLTPLRLDLTDHQELRKREQSTSRGLLGDQRPANTVFAACPLGTRAAAKDTEPLSLGEGGGRCARSPRALLVVSTPAAEAA